MNAKVTRTTESLPDGVYAVSVVSTIAFIRANDAMEALNKARIIFGDNNVGGVTSAITVQDTEVKR